ncbi:MAG TPA: hypothetical protein VIJ46_03975 [Rhabdochlamydiaceae bacterium]
MKITPNKKIKIEVADLQLLAKRAEHHVSKTAIQAVQQLNKENEAEAARLNLRRRQIQPHLIKTQRIS